MEVGYVARVHGLRGELRVALHNPESRALDKLDRVFVMRRGEATPLEYRLVGIRPSNDAKLLALAGVEERASAETFRGATVLVRRDELPKLEPGEYYLADLVGCEVSTPEGTLGTVVELGLYPSVETLVIEQPDGTRVEQPLREPWLESVDTLARTVTLTSREGLIE
ncbi:MAG: rRNA processing protein [Pseudomonadota bacterium]|jgi:16S rRNA processing protein RimM